jgi:hypothetical protein
MNAKSHDFYCPTCNILVAARIIATGSGDVESDAVDPDDIVSSYFQQKHYDVALCPRCDSPFLLEQTINGVPGEVELPADFKILYPSQTRLPLDGVPEPVRRAYEQALKSFSTALYEPCALMCRRCLEGICKSQGAKGASLDAKLQSLQTSGVIDLRMIEWAHCVRMLGNEAAHDFDAAVSREDARDVLDFVEALLIYIFVINLRLKEFKSRRNPL